MYVAISTGYYDAVGNQGTAATATITVDTTGVAAPTFSPANGATVADNTTNITLTFAEAIKKSGGGDFANSDLSGILTLKRTNAGGADIQYAATINGAKTIITINPSSNLPDGAVYVAISTGYYDAVGNQGTATSATITVDTTGVAAPTFSPANGTTVKDNTTNITLTFAEVIKKSGGGDFANADLSGILTLKNTNASGADIPYSATINGAKTVITINPTSNLDDGNVYVAITNGYYDAVGNQGVTATATATFTVDTSLSTDATLSALTASRSTTASGTFTALTLAPAFAAATTAYTASVAHEIAWAKVRPTVSASDTATVRVGKAGSLQPVANGSVSQAISLAVGDNAIRIEVTAEDSSKQTYTVTITRSTLPPSAISLSVQSRVAENIAGGSITVTATLQGGTFNAGSSCTLTAGANSVAVEGALNSGGDYEIGGSFTFATSAQRTATASITIHNDNTAESAERADIETACAGLSATASFTILDDDTPPTSPSELRLTPSNEALTAFWSAPGANDPVVASYDVQYRESGAAVWIDATHTGTERTLQITGLTNDVSYDVRVRAVNNGGESGWTTESGTPRAGPPLEQVHAAVLPEVARALVGRTTNAIASRVEGTMNGGGGNASASLGGQNTVAGALVAFAPDMVNGERDMMDILDGSRFMLPLNGNDGDGVVGSDSTTLWGSGEYRSLSGKSDGLDWSGGMHGAHVGVDTRVRDDLLAGVALSWNQGYLQYDNNAGGAGGKGDYDLDVLGVHPYIGWRAGYVDLWATAGYGTGEVEVKPEQGEVVSNDVALWTVGVGGGGLIWASEVANVRLKGEAMQTTVDVEENEEMTPMSVDASLARVSVEASRTSELVGGGMFSPSLSLGARHDGGDGNTGTGAELSGGVRYENAATGVGASASVYGLFGRNDYEEWGLSGLLQLSPGTDGRGLSVTLRPGYGSGGKDTGRVWTQGMRAEDASSAPTDPSGRLDARLGYGLWAPWSSGLITPWGGLTLDANARQYRAGLDWVFSSRLRMNLSGEQHERLGAGVKTSDRRYRLGVNWVFGDGGLFGVNLSGERFEGADEAAKHSVLLKGTVRF